MLAPSECGVGGAHPLRGLRGGTTQSRCSGTVGEWVQEVLCLGWLKKMGEGPPHNPKPQLIKPPAPVPGHRGAKVSYACNSACMRACVCVCVCGGGEAQQPPTHRPARRPSLPPSVRPSLPPSLPPSHPPARPPPRPPSLPTSHPSSRPSFGVRRGAAAGSEPALWC